MADPTADLDLLLSTERWIKTYPRGRVCAHEGCTTPLSIYNPDEVCAAHVGDLDDMVYHGYAFMLCVECHEVIRKRDASTYGRCEKCSGIKRRTEPRPGYWDGHPVECPVCQKKRALTHANWSMRAEGTRTYRCRVCERAARRRRYAEQKQLAMLK